ncbi:LuxR family transcriptional regulator [Micromonospora craterilacus]|uniref:LuxR family transcriptional regulator n=1 Tax=Micromonospora craterilacus TaxID=1655439 RepID=A0A2W2ENZ9_9ACTN|nr:LuxR family transcriptional regulator [Micromonospora craterilacus]PZG24133.1 LuxR family transcriptional regulator [Micromonospora craterilacus]
MATSKLFGRHAEVEQLSDFVTGVRNRGDAWLIRGEPGVGKSSLIAAAADLAVAAQMRLLRASGSEFEADVSYSCLNQLLLPVHADLERLPPGPREALAVALGFRAGPPPDALLVCNAALLLVKAVAADVPVVLLVDDIQWIDRASAVVLSFIARRLDGCRAGLLASARTGTASLLDPRGLTEIVVPPLDDEAAGHLVDATFPQLTPRIRQRLLDLAQGNPLALMELPSTLVGAVHRTAARPEVVPLSERLQALFAARIAELPEPTRQLLLLATFEGTGDIRVLRAVPDDQPGLADLAPAERAQLVRVDDATARIAFRHPLIRSAIVAMSTHEERRNAHVALADALRGDQERRAWHLAAAAVGPDEAVAELLEDAAHRVMLRGDAFAAVAALIRAAELSLTSSGRGRRLAEAAYIGAEASGAIDDAKTLLTDARRAAPDGTGSLHAANAAAFLMLNGDGDVNTAHRLLVGAIETGDHGYRAEDPALIEAMHTLLLLCWYGSAPEYWEPFYQALGRLQPQPPEVLALASRTFPDPVRTGASALPQIDAILDSLPDDADPTRIMRIGTASVYLDRLADCRESSWRLVQHGRDGGPPRRHLGALMHLCLDDYLVGRWDEAEELAREGQRVCAEGGFSFFAWYFRYNRAIITAGRGRFDEAYALADEMSHWALPRGVSAAALFAHHPRTLAALGQGDWDAAFRHAAAMSPPGVLASHVPHCTWVMFDLVEAAVRTGRMVEARAHVEAMRSADVAALSTRMALILAGAEVLVLDDEAAATRLEELLATPAAERWLFEASRIRLVLGEKLRRARSPSHARRHLLAARDGFVAMAATPWLERTHAELRATKYRLTDVPSDGPLALTAQELQIAQLAATGLTNKQIAERLYLSHRTVGAHLYRIFPKLGVASRAGLRDALSPGPDPR